jgi:hypothetical protein
MTTNPPDAVALETLCEARTRWVKLLGGLDPAVDALPQETRAVVATTSITNKSADFFKRQAPNYRKTRDLSAK